MEIDDKLKNRLAGTAVITVLAVIFLPMLFDDHVEQKAPVISELNIPKKPKDSPLLTTAIIPDKTSEVTKNPKPATANTTTKASEELANNTELSSAELNVGTTPLDSETTVLEEENPAPVKQKTHKKSQAADIDAEKESKPLKYEEKPKAEKNKSKPKLPDLSNDYKDKKQVASAPQKPSLPSLDNKRWVVQVVSLSDEAKATAFRDKLRSQGFPATINSAWIAGKGRVYRLKVGPELDAEKAQSMKAKINQLNNVKSIAIAE